MYFNHEDNLPRTTILGETDKFVVDFEIHDRHPFIHLEIYKFGVSTYKSILYAVENLKFFLGAMGYPMVFGVLSPRQKSMHKLVEKLGFEEYSEFNGNKVYKLHIKDPETFEEVA